MGKNADLIAADAEAQRSDACDLPQVVSAAPVICFGGEDWWYHNRGHFDMQIMRQLAASSPVVYVNSIIMRKPVLREGRHFLRCAVRKLRSMARGLQHVGERFYVYSPVSLPVHHLWWAGGANRWFLVWQVEHVCRKLGMAEPLVWVACPAACDAALQLKRSALVYQRTDRFEEFPNVDAEAVRRSDTRLKQAADLTVFVNRALYEAEASGCRRPFLADHGVDFDLFSTAREDPLVPEDIRDVPRPIAGFFGGIDDHTFDIRLMEQVVEKLPEVSFVLVGKHSVDCSRLAANRNVWMLGQKPYEQIPHYGKCFDVCLMPWRQNRWIEACNPVKLKEYLALGKPIVTTPFPELRHYDGLTYQAVGANAFAEAVEQAISGDNDQRAKQRREYVRDRSWRSVASRLVEAIAECKRRP